MLHAEIGKLLNTAAPIPSASGPIVTNQTQTENILEDKKKPRLEYEIQDPSIWGASFWNGLHTQAASYDLPNAVDWVTMNPEIDFETTKNAYFHYFESLQYTLPCPNCRKHYREFWKTNPVSGYLKNSRQDTQGSLGKLDEWVNQLHNYVNRRNEKKEWTIEETRKKYDNTKMFNPDESETETVNVVAPVQPLKPAQQQPSAPMGFLANKSIKTVGVGNVGSLYFQTHQLQRFIPTHIKPNQSNQKQLFTMNFNRPQFAMKVMSTKTLLKQPLKNATRAKPKKCGCRK